MAERARIYVPRWPTQRAILIQGVRRILKHATPEVWFVQLLDPTRRQLAESDVLAFNSHDAALKRAHQWRAACGLPIVDGGLQVMEPTSAA